MKLLLFASATATLTLPIAAGPAFAQAPPLPPTPAPATAAVVPQQANYELPPMFEASNLLPPQWIAGPHHRVRELVPSDGYLTHFTIDSDYGTFECIGIREVKLRIYEIEAIGKLVDFSKSDLFAEGVKRSVKAPIKAVQNIAGNPVGAVEQVPHTVGHFFSQVGSSVGSAVRGNKNAEVAASGEPEKKKSLVRSVAGIAGFDKAKLTIARELGVDPYTSNVRLQEEMEKVTWALFAGGLPLKIGVGVASSGASLALNATEFIGLPEEIYEVTPSELALQHRRTMEAMGVPVETIDLVIGNKLLSPSMRHAMIAHIQALGRLEGQQHLVALLTHCQNARQSIFLKNILELMTRRHQVQPYAGYGVFGKLPAGMTPAGVMEVCTPVDYVSWTEQVAAFVGRSDWGDIPKRLVLEGTLSERAMAETQAAGWEILQVTQ